MKMYQAVTLAIALSGAQGYFLVYGAAHLFPRQPIVWLGAWVLSIVISAFIGKGVGTWAGKKL